MLTSHLHLLPSFATGEDLPLRPHIPSCCAKENLKLSKSSRNELNHLRCVGCIRLLLAEQSGRHNPDGPPANYLLFTITSRSRRYEGPIILPIADSSGRLGFCDWGLSAKYGLTAARYRNSRSSTYLVLEGYPSQMSARWPGYVDRSNSGIIAWIQILPNECTYGFHMILIISYINAFVCVSETKCVLCVIFTSF